MCFASSLEGSCCRSVNLLREGLDLPEVSMVAILDADKEGFLRNYRSLIQTMGRASRNVNGTVLLFADNMTDSLDKAIAETTRRRALQEAFNQEHGIVPKSVSRKLEDDLVINDPLAELWKGDKNTASKMRDAEPEEEDEPQSIEELEKQMKEAAAKLDFEEAARLRDIIRGMKT